MQFNEVLQYCIDNKITLNHFLVIYANKVDSFLYDKYKKINGYDIGNGNQVLSKYMVEDFIDKGYAERDKNNKIKFTDKSNEIIELFNK